MVLKVAPKVLYTGLSGQIGTPEDYTKNKAKNYFPSYDTKIPLPKDSTFDEDDLDAALCGMRLSDGEDNQKEEVKGGFKTGARIQDMKTR